MTVLTLLILAVALGGAMYFWTVGKQPAANEPLTQDMLRACLEMLLYRGMQGGQLRICVRGSAKEIYLHKYVPSSGAAGIRTEFRALGWAAEYVDSFRQELDGRGIKYAATSGSSAQNVCDVAMDFGQDLGLAQFVIVLLFERVLGARLATDGVGYFNDKVLPIDMPRLAGVTRPAQ